MKSNLPKKLVKDKDVERAWKRFEKAAKYLQRTSRTDVTWRELLDRPYEVCR